MLARLEPVLHEPPPDWQPKELPAEKRRDVLVSKNAPEPIRILMGGEALLDAYGRYAEALAEELARVACALDDVRIAGRFVERMRELDALAVLDAHLRTGCPALIRKLDETERQALTDATAEAALAAAAAKDASQAPPSRSPR